MNSYTNTHVYVFIFSTRMNTSEPSKLPQPQYHTCGFAQLFRQQNSFKMTLLPILWRLPPQILAVEKFYHVASAVGTAGTKERLVIPALPFKLPYTLCKRQLLSCVLFNLRAQYLFTLFKIQVV